MLLSTDSIARMEGVRRVHTLNPVAIRIDKSLGDEVGLKNIGIHLISIAPGDKSTEFHSHKYEEEAIYVLSGHGTEVMGETTQKIGPGISSVSPAAAWRMRRSTTARSRSSASSSASACRKMSSTTRAKANGFTATAASAIWSIIRTLKSAEFFLCAALAS